MAWDVVAFYVWHALMLYVYNEVYPIVSRRALLYFLAVAGAAAGRPRRCYKTSAPWSVMWTSISSLTPNLPGR